VPKIVDHDARRRELVRAAWRVVGRDGLDGLTTRAVAREAGWSTGVLAHYFDNREELLLAAFRLVFDEAMQRMQDTLAAHSDPMRALTNALLEAVPLTTRQHTEAIVWFTFLGLAAGQPTLHAEAQTRYGLWLDLIEHAVQAVVPDRGSTETRRIARLLVSHVDGLTIQAIFDSHGLPIPQLEIELRESIRVTLAAAASPRSSETEEAHDAEAHRGPVSGRRGAGRRPCHENTPEPEPGDESP
jgi:TetR/AcrR family transcriptional repressor of bet genes